MDQQVRVFDQQVTEASRGARARPRAEAFDHYAPFLRAMVIHLKETDPKFSYRYFSRRAGFSSPNFLKLVADGQRNLTPASIPKFARGLSLNEREREAFETLVLMSLARTDEERNRYYAKLRRFGQGRGTVRRAEPDEYDVYSLWFVLPIRELLSHADFQEDPAWIARRLYPRIRPTDARRALEILEGTGLARRNDDGKLVPADLESPTGPRVRSLAIRNYQRAMLGLASECVDGLASEERDIATHTLSLTSGQLEQLRAMSARFREEVALTLGAEAGEGETTEVYQLSLQLFPVSRKDK